jgi:BolA family transcriptional regulator, general stress-responsive regulator
MNRQTQIETLLVQTFAPKHFSVENESHMHSSGAGAETHFRVVLVTDAFEGKSLVARHRLVNEVLKPVFAGGLHALSVIPKTVQEYATTGELPKSPACAS